MAPPSPPSARQKVPVISLSPRLPPLPFPKQHLLLMNAARAVFEVYRTRTVDT